MINGWDDIILEEANVPYEEEILRNPYTLKCWLRYIDHKKSAPPHVVNLVYERALRELPGSYKLWHAYLTLRRQQLSKRNIDHHSYQDVNNTFERALSYMHKMPRIWLDYLSFLMQQGYIIRTRVTFNKALQSLPVTQHDRIWKVYLEYLLKSPGLTETITRAYRRYLKLIPECTEDYIDYLVSVDLLDEACELLVKIINDDKFRSKNGKSRHQLWNELCELMSNNPDKVVNLKVDPIIREGIKKYTDQVGALWNSLANYFIKSKVFMKARDIYEEAMVCVSTVNDFSKVFDAYMLFLEQEYNAKMQLVIETGKTADDEIELEMLLQRLEYLIERRRLLLNSVMLRQNPHNVYMWHDRVKHFEGKPKKIIETYTQAIKTIDPKNNNGKFYTIWQEFAKYYEQANQLDDARAVFERGLTIDFKSVDELASLVCLYVEFELRNKNFDNPKKILRKAVTPVAGIVNYHDNNEPVQNRVYKSLKVWSLYADIEENFGTHLTCKSVYDRMLDLRIASPQVILNYATYLEEKNYFEESFKVFEKGIALFKWPIVYEIWNTYLSKFTARYQNTKMERSRDLFEQCLEHCPAIFSKPILLMYAKIEEEHGQTRQAMHIYERAVDKVPPEEKYEMFNMHIRRASELIGLTRTRPIYEKALQELDKEQAIDMALRFAELECKLCEIDRARGIYVYASQMCDPRVATVFWGTWKDFETRHGNEDTIKELMRLKNSVMAVYNTQVNFMSAQMLTAQKVRQDSIEEGTNSMKDLEAQARQLSHENDLDQAPGNKTIQFSRGASRDEEIGEVAKTLNPDEIEIDDEDEEDAEMTEDYPLENRQVPNEVFGNLVSNN